MNASYQATGSNKEKIMVSVLSLLRVALGSFLNPSNLVSEFKMFVNTAPHLLIAFETFLNEVNDNAHVDKDGTVG